MACSHGEIHGEICNVFSAAKRIVFGVATHMWKDHRKGLYALASVGAAFHIYKIVQQRKKRKKWLSAGKDVIVVHGFRRGKTCVNISPFGLKLEAYLRLCDINYIFDTEDPLGPKKKSPWITLNGEEYSDSQLIMDHVGVKFNKDFSTHLPNEQKAAARAIAIMVDEHLYSTGNWWILKDPQSRFLELTAYPTWVLKTLMVLIFRKSIKRELYYNGLGRHSDEEYVEMMRRDCKALSLYLGEKKFMMGENPSEVDCSVFGTLAMAYWILPGSPFEKMLKGEFRNLGAYCERVKETLFPDWDQLLEK